MKKKHVLLKIGIPGIKSLSKVISKNLTLKFERKNGSKNFSSVDQYIESKNYESRVKYIHKTGRLL